MAQPLEESTLPPGPHRLRAVHSEPGVRLEDLLRTARLTPRQVAYIAVEVLHDLAVRHARGEAHGGLALQAVRIGTATGHVRLEEACRDENPEDWLLAPAAADGADARRADLAAAAALLSGLVDSARTPAAAREPRTAAVLAALDEVVEALREKTTGAPVPSLTALLATLSLVGEARGRHRGADAELATLAKSAAGGTRPVLPAPPPPPPVPRPGRPQPRRAWGSARIAARRGLNRLTVLLLAVAALGAVVILEFTFLGDKLSADLRLLTGEGKPAAAAPPVAAVHAPAALPVLGPAAAGHLTAVHLRAVGTCRPQEDCLLRVIVAARPRDRSTTVRWHLTIVDRCTEARTAGPAGTLRIPPDTGTGSALTTLRVGRGAFGVVARTDRPVRIAGPALPVPAVAPTSC